MVVFRKKKSKKFRGSKTHGWGAMKKHRGAGNRGGRGNAGTGKRGDAMKTLHWKETYFGKHGFKKQGQVKEIKPVNLQYFEENIDNLVSQKKAVKQGDSYTVNVFDLGFNKVLGTGKLTKKLKITSELFSSNAEEKIKNAGGEAIKLVKEVNSVKSVKAVKVVEAVKEAKVINAVKKEAKTTVKKAAKQSE